jgi:hypothetical protein
MAVRYARGHTPAAISRGYLITTDGFMKNACARTENSRVTVETGEREWEVGGKKQACGT